MHHQDLWKMCYTCKGMINAISHRGGCDAWFFLRGICPFLAAQQLPVSPQVALRLRAQRRHVLCGSKNVGSL